MLQLWIAPLLCALQQTPAPPAKGVYFGTKVEEMATGSSGVKVVDVVPKSPAAEAGIEVDDVIVRLGDVAIRGLDDFVAALESRKPGDAVSVVFRRGTGRGEERTAQAFLRARVPEDLARVASIRAHRTEAPPPPEKAAPVPMPQGGAASSGLARRAYLGVIGEAKDGKYTLLQVVPGTPAERAGLRPGDLILSMDGKELQVQDDLRRSIRERKPGDTARLLVERQGAVQDVKVVLGEAPDEDVVTVTRQTVLETAHETPAPPALEVDPRVQEVPLRGGSLHSEPLQAQESPREAGQRGREVQALRREVADLRLQLELLRLEMAELRQTLARLQSPKK